MRDDLEDESPTTLQGFLVEENSFGQILKLQVEKSEGFFMTSSVRFGHDTREGGSQVGEGLRESRGTLVEAADQGMT